MNRRDLLKWAGTAAGAHNIFAATYRSTWDSIDSRPIPAWYSGAKFGIFIHWGVYSVPAFAAPHIKDQNPYAEWYWNSLTLGRQGNGHGPGAATWEYHKKVYGPNFTYFEFAPMFKAQLYDPNEWADLIQRSGAQYVALTSKHHEGFTLWQNEQANRSWGRPWNAVDIGPKRDLLLDLMQAGRRKNLHMGIYYSLYEWYNPLWLNDKPRFVSEHLFPQFKDVVTHAQPDIIFSDGEWEMTSDKWRSPELLAWLYNESPVKDYVVVDDRWGKDTRHKHGGYYTTEYTSGMQHATRPWEESRGMGFSYGYNRAEGIADYHTSRQLLMMLIDIVSRGGNFLLDIGPRADGEIPAIMQDRLIGMGDWLKPNGEAIYGTTACPRAAQWSEGQRQKLEESEFRAAYDITQLVDAPPAGFAHVEAFLTRKNDQIFAIIPRLPAKDELVLRGINAEKAEVLGGAQLQTTQRGPDLVIQIPESIRDVRTEAHVIRLSGAKMAEVG